MTGKIINLLIKPVKTAPLAAFRILFGLLMMIAIIRFIAHGWVAEFYIEPQFFFKYYGFEFVKPLGNYTYLLFFIAFISALGIMLGYKYKISALLFFLSFTYIELMDKTTYLNHYYFVSLMSFILIFLPANTYFSIDAKQNPKIAFKKIPRYNILAIKLLISIVYFYAGLAKINSDWLCKAMPLKIWLPSKYNLPILGNLFQQEWMHYFMSWSGMLYDLAIPFLLFYRKTRMLAFVLVIIFHVLTRILFPIGIFPFVMIFSALIFFEASFHEKIIAFLKRIFKINTSISYQTLYWKSTLKNQLIVYSLILFFIIQLLFPFRYLLYPGELFWTEEGYRFSWRVMLMEKAGYANFKIVDPETGNYFYIDNADFLTDFQQKQMATQPDFIVQYANYLADYYKTQGIKNPKIYVESYVALNGRRSQPYINPNVDLAQEKESLQHKTWILDFKDEIKGF